MPDFPTDALGLYISIPFCRSKCTYCNFASGVYPASEHARYVDRLIADLAASRAWAARMGVELPRRVDTVYLGGGTPSLLAPELITRLFAAVRAEFDLDPEAEITAECAPGQLPDEVLAALTAAGVNRASLGVQSFIDSEAKRCGRLHSRTIALADIERLRSAGIHNLSVDLIAGLAGQSLASWEESLAVLAATAVAHASIYMLEVDEDSRLGREVLGGGARYHADLVPSDDAVAQMYSVAIERLKLAGLEQYEISNFCQPGMESRHNLRYWQRRPYLGLGLDASSMLREAQPSATAEKTDVLKGHDFSRAVTAAKSTRPLGPEGCLSEARIKSRPFSAACKTAGETPMIKDTFPQGLKPTNSSADRTARLKPCPFKEEKLQDASMRVLRATTTSDLKAYLAGAPLAETEWLARARQHEEAWFLGLRLNAGLSVAAVEREFGHAMTAPALKAAARLVETGLLVSGGGTLRLTPRGQLLSNEAFQEFLGLNEESGSDADRDVERARL
jgi:oxygen-independent coproporphyrinogen-3 oxidase